MMSRSLFCAALFAAATSSMAIEEPEVHLPAPPPPPGPPAPCGAPPPPPPPPPPGPPCVAEAGVADATIIDNTDINLLDNVAVGDGCLKAVNWATGTAVPVAASTGSLCDDSLLVKRAEFAYRVGPSGYASGTGLAMAAPSGTAIRLGPAATGVSHALAAPSGTAINLGTAASGISHALAAPSGTAVPMGPAATGISHALAAPSGTAINLGTAASGISHALAAPSGTAIRAGTAAPAGTAINKNVAVGTGTAVGTGFARDPSPGTAAPFATGIAKAPSTASGVSYGTAAPHATGTGTCSGVEHKDHAPVDHEAHGDQYLNRRDILDGDACAAEVVVPETVVPVAVETEVFVPKKEPCGCPTYAKLLGRACPHAVTTGTAIEVVQPVAVTETAFVATGTAAVRGPCGCPSYGTLLPRQCPHATAVTAVTAYGTAAPALVAGTASLKSIYNKAYATELNSLPVATATPVGTLAPIASAGCGCASAKILARQCPHELPNIVGTGTGYATGTVYSASTQFTGTFIGTGTVNPVQTLVAAPAVEHLVDSSCPDRQLKLVARACPSGTGGLRADPPAPTGSAVSAYRLKDGDAPVPGTAVSAYRLKAAGDPPAPTGTGYRAASGTVMTAYPTGSARKAIATGTGISYATGTAGLRAQIADPLDGTAGLSIVHGPTAVASSGSCNRHSLHRRADDDEAASNDSAESEKDATEDATDAESGAGRVSGGLFGVAAAVAVAVALL